jgi:hypothetical protein
MTNMKSIEDKTLENLITNDVDEAIHKMGEEITNSDWCFLSQLLLFVIWMDGVKFED